MRWLAIKDLQVLRRSPLLVAMLVAYPIIISVLIGLALSRGPEKPKVAFFNEVPKGAATVKLGGESIDTSQYAGELFKSVTPIRVNSRAEAIATVKSGEALGAEASGVPSSLPCSLPFAPGSLVTAPLPVAPGQRR